MSNCWLLKTEPTSYSIDDLKEDKKTSWGGVRNYQARNFISSMKKGDMVLIYHSGGLSPAVTGIGKVTADPYPDPTQFDRKDSHYDPKASKEKPIWTAVDIGFVSKLKEPLTLFQIKQDNTLNSMAVTQKGSRLSVLPVSQNHFEYIERKY